MWLTVAACAASPSRYDAYRAAHPDWQPDFFPAESTDLDELIAALDRPPPDHTTRRVSPLRAWTAGPDERWTAADVDAIDLATTHAVLVSATLNCYYHHSLTERIAARRVWYLLLGARLVAFDHYECSGDPADMLTALFRRTTQARAALEKSALAMLGGEPESDAAWSWGCPSDEAYRRGFAYFDRHRFDEAEEMLRVGDGALDLARDSACLHGSEEKRDLLVRGLRQEGRSP